MHLCRGRMAAPPASVQRDVHPRAGDGRAFGAAIPQPVAGAPRAPPRHPELVSGSIWPPALLSPAWMLKQACPEPVAGPTKGVLDLEVELPAMPVDIPEELAV